MTQPIKNKWALLAARLVIGLFGGSSTVISAHISQVTTMEERTRWMTFNTIGSTLGFIIGPAFSIGLSQIDFSVGKFHFNAYTSPGYASALVALISIPVLIFAFNDVTKKEKEKKTLKVGNVSYSKPALGLCIFFTFTNVVCLGTFETVTTPFTNSLYNYGVFENSVLYSVIGLVCVISFVMLAVLDHCKLENRMMNVGSIFVMYIGFCMLLQDPLLSQLRFWSGAILIAYGYSPASALIVSIFSKVIPQSQQGLKMGAFTSGGSLARIGAPILSSYISQFYGYNTLWFTISCLLIFACLLHIVVFDILKPLPDVELMDSETSYEPSKKLNKSVPDYGAVSANDDTISRDDEGTIN